MYWICRLHPILMQLLIFHLVMASTPNHHSESDAHTADLAAANLLEQVREVLLEELESWPFEQVINTQARCRMLSYELRKRIEMTPDMPEHLCPGLCERQKRQLVASIDAVRSVAFMVQGFSCFLVPLICSDSNGVYVGFPEAAITQPSLFYMRSSAMRSIAERALAMVSDICRNQLSYVGDMPSWDKLDQKLGNVLKSIHKICKLVSSRPAIADSARQPLAQVAVTVAHFPAMCFCSARITYPSVISVMQDRRVIPDVTRWVIDRYCHPFTLASYAAMDGWQLSDLFPNPESFPCSQSRSQCPPVEV